MKPILEIRDIGKKYRINHEANQPYLSLRESITGIFGRKSSKEDFWALKDVSFDVNPGESIGIIGKNGAGKSTLLKVLSRITPPTTGKIISRGRIASLLEVGTGFHAELTGRENIFMNGSILGMKRSEIQKNFDAIVDFSGVEKFLDTPLKHYSSGMQLRLAFSVAAFLENEILIIDEVLAVGDAEFQKKCLGKMGEVSKSGRTVLFVSHNAESILTLCSKGILMNQGTIESIGTVPEILSLYENEFQESFKYWDKDKRPGDNMVKLDYIRILNSNDNQVNYVSTTEEFRIEIQMEVFGDNIKPAPNFHFYTTNNIYCFVSISNVEPLSKGVYKFSAFVPKNLLNNRTYRIGVALTTLNTGHVHLYEKEIINLDVIENKAERNHEYNGDIPGVFRPIFESKIEKIN